MTQTPDRAFVEAGANHHHVLVGPLFQYLAFAMDFSQQPTIRCRNPNFEYGSLATDAIAQRCAKRIESAA